MSSIPRALTVLHAGSRRDTSGGLSAFTVLPQPLFLEKLRLEKRRADRSGAALSVMLLVNAEDETGPVRQLWQFLRKTVRETDSIGYLGQGVIGIILPDTDRTGLQGFQAKITADSTSQLFVIAAATYPDQLFEHLLDQNGQTENSYPLLIDAFEEPVRFGHGLKRLMDCGGALLALLLFAPLMLITALAIKLTSPGPVIFRQVRMGQRGVPFVFYKFRSMYCNADDRVHRAYVTQLISGQHQDLNNGDTHKPFYKLKFDSRVTRVGRFIRKTSIDELPQLFNVLKGDMSLVGPRPPLPYEVNNYQPWHLRRILEVKPGITGLWQVNGRSETTFEEMVRLDIRYIQHWSLWLDIKILLQTVRAVIQCRGTG